MVIIVNADLPVLHGLTVPAGCWLYKEKVRDGYHQLFYGIYGWVVVVFVPR